MYLKRVFNASDDSLDIGFEVATKTIPIISNRFIYFLLEIVHDRDVVFHAILWRIQVMTQLQKSLQRYRIDWRSSSRLRIGFDAYFG